MSELFNSHEEWFLSCVAQASLHVNNYRLYFHIFQSFYQFVFRVIIPESLMETEESATNFESGTDLFVQNVLAQRKSIVKKMDSH